MSAYKPMREDANYWRGYQAGREVGWTEFPWVMPIWLRRIVGKVKR